MRLRNATLKIRTKNIERWPVVFKKHFVLATTNLHPNLKILNPFSATLIPFLLYDTMVFVYYWLSMGHNSVDFIIL